jgi:hypothetical protein
MPAICSSKSKSGIIAELQNRFLGAFGAIITILTLAFHTLVQNAISTRSGMLELTSLYGDPDYGAKYPQGNNYTDKFLDYTTGTVVGDQGPSLDMVADISHGLYYTSMDFDTQFQLSIAQCPSGNCTWKNIQTLSVCSQCADISSLIGHDQGYYTLYGTKVAMDESIGLVSSLADSNYPDSTVLSGVGPLIAHITTLARPNLTSDPLGIDCALYWCVWDRSDVKMIDWNITDSVDVFWTDPSVTTTHQQTNNIELTPPTCYNEHSEPIDTSQCTKTISPYSQVGLQNYFIGDRSGFTGSVNLTEGWDVSNYVMQIIYSTAGVSSNLASDMEGIMNYMGLMMTSNIQQTIQDGISFTYGNVWIYTTLFKIRWGYMVLPTILVVGSVIFMIVTIIKSLGHEKWKSSVLPLLFHPLADEVRPGAAPHKMSELKAVAENKEVRLERGHLGSQFV